VRDGDSLGVKETVFVMVKFIDSVGESSSLVTEGLMLSVSVAELVNEAKFVRDIVNVWDLVSVGVPLIPFVLEGPDSEYVSEAVNVTVLD